MLRAPALPSPRFALPVVGLGLAVALLAGAFPTAGGHHGAPAVPAGAARLTFAASEHDLGQVQPGSDQEVLLPWRRDGPGALRVLATRTGCGCAGWSGLPERLAEGAAGTATLRLRLASEPGPLEVSARVVTDAAAPDDVVTVRVRAFVGDRAVVRPAWLDLGRRSPGARVPAALEVHLPPGAAEHVRCELVAWAGEVTPLPAARRGRRGADLRLASLLVGRPGVRSGALRVLTAAGDVLVPLRAEVVAADGPRPAVNGP